MDNAGNSASATVNINIDKTPPSITIAGIQKSASYNLCAVPTPSVTVTDSLSGVASDTVTLTGAKSSGVGRSRIP